MTQQEITNYNKLCAEFLGAIYSEHAEAWGFGNAKNIGSKMFDGVMYNDVIQAERFEKELKFHSDWNWIMEICIGIGMEFVTTNKEQLIQQIYDKLRNMEIKSNRRKFFNII